MLYCNDCLVVVILNIKLNSNIHNIGSGSNNLHSHDVPYLKHAVTTSRKLMCGKEKGCALNKESYGELAAGSRVGQLQLKVILQRFSQLARRIQDSENKIRGLILI